MAGNLLARGSEVWSRCHPWGGGLVPRTSLRLLVGALAIGGSLAWLAAPAASQTAGGTWTLFVANIDSGDVTPVDLGTNAAQAGHRHRPGAVRRLRSPPTRPPPTSPTPSPATVTPIDVASSTPRRPHRGEQRSHRRSPSRPTAPSPSSSTWFEQRHADRRRDEHRGHRHRGRQRAVSGSRSHRTAARHTSRTVIRTTSRRSTSPRGPPVRRSQWARVRRRSPSRLTAPPPTSRTPIGEQRHPDRSRHEHRRHHDRVGQRPAWRSPSRPTAPPPTSPT